MSQLTTPPSPFADFPPVRENVPLTNAQTLARSAGEVKPGFGTATWESTSHWATAWANRTLRRVGQGMVTEFDPTFVATDDLVKQYGEGLDPRYQAKMYGARSLDDMMELRDQYVDLQKSDAIIARTLHPTAAGLLAGLADPVYLAAGIATGGAINPVEGVLARAGMGATMARLTANGIVNVASAAPIQAFVSSQDPQSNLTSDILDGAIGMIAIEVGRHGLGRGARLALNKLGLAKKDIEFAGVLDAASTWEKIQRTGGGAAGAFESDPTFQAIAGLARLNDAAKQALEKHLLTPNGKDYFFEQLDPDGPAKFMDRYVEDAGFDPVKDKAHIANLRALQDDIYALKFSKGTIEPPEMGKLDYGPEMPNTATADAPGFLPPESTEPPRPPPRKEDFFPKIEDWNPAYKNGRFSRIGVIGRSVSRKANEIGNALWGDPLGKVDAQGNVRPSYTAVDEWRRVSATREHVAFQSVYKKGLEDWLRTNRVPAGDRLAAEDTFRKILHDVHLGVIENNDPLIGAIVDATRAQADRLRQLMQRHGAMRTDVPHDPKYLRRSYSIPRTNGALERYGSDQMETFFGKALRETDGRKTFDNTKVKQIGSTLLRQVLRTDIPLTQRAFSLSEGLLNELEDKLKAMGLSDAQIKDALYTASGDGSGGVSGAKANPTKSRIDFNHNFTMELENLQTGGLETVRLVDLLDHDYEAIVHDMIDTSVSMSAEKRTMEAFGQAHGRTYTRPQELFDEVAKELHAKNASDTEIATTIAYLERGWRGAMGRSMNPTSGWSEFWRAMRGVNSIAGSAMFGLAQVPQLGTAVATSGLRTVLSGVPEFASLLKQFKSGRVTDSTLKLLDSITAADADALQQTWLQRTDDRNIGKWSRINSALDKANSVIRTASGIEPINRVLRRSAAAGAINRWIEAAQSGKLPNKARLAQLGVSPDEATRILSAISNDLKGTYEGPILDKVNRLNLDKWEPELAARFMGTIDRWASISADRSTLGSSSDWMDTTVGKVLTQWRTFTLQAWEKQTLARIQSNDFEAWAGATYSLMIGALTYSAQMYIRAMTMPEDDRRTFLDERLSTERLATSAFNRGAFSSLMPMGYDTMQGITGGKQIFTYGRYSGLPNDVMFWQSNPTANLIGSVFNGAFPRTVGPLIDTASNAIGGEGTMAGRFLKPRAGMDNYDQRAAKAWIQLAPARTMIGIQNFYDYLARQLPEPDAH